MMMACSSSELSELLHSFLLIYRSSGVHCAWFIKEATALPLGAQKISDFDSSLTRAQWTA